MGNTAQWSEEHPHFLMFLLFLLSLAGCAAVFLRTWRAIAILMWQAATFSDLTGSLLLEP
jgi:hypothetical protein